MNDTEKTEKENQEDAKLSDNGSPETGKEQSPTDTIPDTPKEPEAQEDIVVSLKKEIEIQNDKHLRLYAEFENFRRRTSKERLELFKNASEDIILSLLPVLDDLERALQSINSSKETESTKTGIELIYNKFFIILQQKGLKVMKSKDEKFNSEFHQAISTIDVEKKEQDGIIIEESEKGYFLYDKVIRFAKVFVGKYKEKSDV